MNVIKGTVDLTRDFGRPVEAVFAAWSDKDAQLIWGDPGEGWSISFERFDFAAGRTDLCRFGPEGGQQYLNENRYLVIEPGKQIVYSTSLASDDCVSFAGTVAVSFETRSNGCRLRLIEQGLYLDGNDDTEGHRTGWESMLEALGRYLHR
ncbi:SRPBCC domain-containing protein [Paracoccus sp. 11-3]|uniref:SRPBCC domain-containing protein n=1 Tax=Paracoccus amoyensis TaxID=2760093 RepID=A0A926GAQ3_9RHOB|nr:SRPBCC domain-containing protein [Paracoccus amoyensis]MBC9247563.1 SRPBCC domain-containing protein [Paracoccus amoyensis]